MYDNFEKSCLLLLNYIFSQFLVVNFDWKYLENVAELNYNFFTIFGSILIANTCRMLPAKFAMLHHLVMVL